MLELDRQIRARFRATFQATLEASVAYGGVEPLLSDLVEVAVIAVQETLLASPQSSNHYALRGED